MASFFDQFQPAAADPEQQRVQMQLMQELRKPTAPPAQFERMMSPDQMAEQARALRNQQATGAVLQSLGGNTGVGRTGAQLMRGQSAEEYMTQQARQEQVRQYQQWQADAASQNREVTRLTKTLDLMQKETDEIDRVVPQGMANTLLKSAKHMKTIEKLRSQGGVDMTQQTGEWLRKHGVNTGVGLENIAEEFAAKVTRRGIEAPQEIKNQMQFWADLNAGLIAPWRKDLFGQTLTPNEQEAFRQLANMTPNMSWQEIDRRLYNLQSAMTEETKDRLLLINQNYGSRFARGMEDVFDGSLDQELPPVYRGEETPGSSSSSTGKYDGWSVEPVTPAGARGRNR